MAIEQKEEPGSTAKMPAQLNSLTGLRWVAAFMVFVSHALYLPNAVPQGEVGTAINTGVALAGYVGVSVFFVLSGFVLTWSSRANDTAPKFWRRRFFKIYPNHFVAFLIAVVFVLWMGEQVGFAPLSDQLPGLIPQVLLLHAWLPDLQAAFAFNTVSWTLSVEAVFYLCFPLLLAAVTRIRVDRLWYWVGGLVLVVFCVPQVADLLSDGGGDAAYLGLSSWEYWFVYVLPVTRLPEFVIGILLARIVMAGRWINVPLWLAGVIFAAGYVVTLNVPKSYAIVAATIIPIVLLIPAAATADIRGRRRSPLATRPMVWLGNISYAFYLVHLFSIIFVLYIIGLDFQAGTYLHTAGFVGVTLTMSILASWALYGLVERPMQRRFATKRRPSVEHRPGKVEVSP
ncbi:acyltransferase [Microtetraspora sp. NBRC 13810]|uniref:acyltransferase family protein n=1 Tax=Microtetraspora sp. NBRC 13810 TaxID=3030990 RepID=UPI0024A51249|nr:acyltransferase [Microtetraspora sp. NBRC 13810]GLW09419.1 acyltransferase [Microtetraspora sp. NBRC 13810]